MNTQATQPLAPGRPTEQRAVGSPIFTEEDWKRLAERFKLTGAASINRRRGKKPIPINDRQFAAGPAQKRLRRPPSVPPPERLEPTPHASTHAMAKNVEKHRNLTLDAWFPSESMPAEVNARENQFSLTRAVAITGSAAHIQLEETARSIQTRMKDKTPAKPKS